MTISGKALLAGVMGWPVAHSRSPRLHNFWLAQYTIDGAYVPLAVPPDAFERALRALPWLGFRGANVTLPHKQAAFAAVDRCDAFARRTGAVNTVVVEDDGTLAGRNTDGFGFIESLRAARPGWRGDAGPAVVLGAGGAARAILAALQDEGAGEIRLLNRTPERADALAARFAPGIAVLPWQTRSDALAGAALLVNTTSLGMVGAPPLEIALDALPAAAMVADIVYVPRATALLTAARGRGHAIADGLEMLLHQARPGFAAWFGREPEVTDALRAWVAEGLD